MPEQAIEKSAQERLAEQKLADRKAMNILVSVAFGFVALVTLIIIIWYAATPKSPEDRLIARNPAYLSIGTEEQITSLFKEDVLYKILPESSKAFIDEGVWQVCSYDLKERLGQTLAFYCGRKRGTGFNWVGIYDWKTKGILAVYNESTGLKTY
jgi:hypothetical protein